MDRISEGSCLQDWAGLTTTAASRLSTSERASERERVISSAAESAGTERDYAAPAFPCFAGDRCTYGFAALVCRPPRARFEILRTHFPFIE